MGTLEDLMSAADREDQQTRLAGFTNNGIGTQIGISSNGGSSPFNPLGNGGGSGVTFLDGFTNNGPGTQIGIERNFQSLEELFNSIAGREGQQFPSINPGPFINTNFPPIPPFLGRPGPFPSPAGGSGGGTFLSGFTNNGGGTQIGIGRNGQRLRKLLKQIADREAQQILIDQFTNNGPGIQVGFETNIPSENNRGGYGRQAQGLSAEGRGAQQAFSGFINHGTGSQAGITTNQDSFAGGAQTSFGAFQNHGAGRQVGIEHNGINLVPPPPPPAPVPKCEYSST